MMKDNLNVNVLALCIMISSLATNFKNKKLKHAIKVGDIKDFKKISIFNIGEEVEKNKGFFTGRAWVSNLENIQKGMSNITLEPKCKTLWRKNDDKYEILISVGGIGEYQKENEKVKQINFGDIIFIEPGEKFWLGANEKSWFNFFSLVVDKQ